MRRAAAAVLLGLLAGCAIAPAPPSPDPILADAVAEGGLGAADPAQAAFCVSQSVPLSLVLLVPDGAAVRPAAPVPADYALTFRRSGQRLAAPGGAGRSRHRGPARPGPGRLRRPAGRAGMSGAGNLPLSGARLWDSLMRMAAIGATPKGGCNRQALTDLDGEGRALLQGWAEACGLTMSLDRLGNMAFRREGRDPTRAPVAIGSHLDTQPTGAYLELHIEQGRVLEDGGFDIGIVTHALGQSWFEVTIEGEESHGGSAMAGRRDALMAAAPLMAAVEEIALAAVSPTGEAGRGTVGCVGVHPASRNVAPGRAWFSVDMRHGDPERLDWMGRELAARAAGIAAARHVTATVAPFWHSPLTPFDEALVRRAREAAAARGLRWRDIPTGIGHDAVHCARRVPTVMLFTPCHGGISHNEAESITPDWATAELRVLADAALGTAGLVGA